MRALFKTLDRGWGAGDIGENDLPFNFVRYGTSRKKKKWCCPAMGSGRSSMEATRTGKLKEER